MKSDEVSPATLYTISVSDPSLEMKRREALRHKYHLTICLSG